MGDRISISFVKNDEPEYNRESVALFHHWGGRDFPKSVLRYLKDLKAWKIQAKGTFEGSGPLARYEPHTVMADFCRWYFNGKDRIASSIYFGKDSNDGDNSDNGHHTFDLALLDDNDVIECWSG